VIEFAKTLSKSHKKFNEGDVIDFWAGFSDHIRYRAEIIGFEGDDIYLMWDSYWAPIKDDKIREIEVVG